MARIIYFLPLLVFIDVIDVNSYPTADHFKENGVILKRAIRSEIHLKDVATFEKHLKMVVKRDREVKAKIKTFLPTMQSLPADDPVGIPKKIFTTLSKDLGVDAMIHGLTQWIKAFRHHVKKMTKEKLDYEIYLIKESFRVILPLIDVWYTFLTVEVDFLKANIGKKKVVVSNEYVTKLETYFAGFRDFIFRLYLTVLESIHKNAASNQQNTIAEVENKLKPIINTLKDQIDRINKWMKANSS